MWLPNSGVRHNGSASLAADPNRTNFGHGVAKGPADADRPTTH